MDGEGDRCGPGSQHFNNRADIALTGIHGANVEHKSIPFLIRPGNDCFHLKRPGGGCDLNISQFP